MNIIFILKYVYFISTLLSCEFKSVRLIQKRWKLSLIKYLHDKADIEHFFKIKSRVIELIN